MEFFASLNSKEEWGRPLLNNLGFDSIGEERSAWLEREFEEEEVKKGGF